MTYPGTREVVYTFDRRFRMTGVSGGTGVGGTRGLDVADQVISSSFANGVSSVFDYDVNGRMTHMERFKNGAPPTMLVEYDYGYDAVGNRLYTRDLMATNRSELYGYDARNRLRNFERGTLNTAGDDISTPLVDPALPSQQQWTDLDRRGNWLDFSTTLNGQPAVQQTREANQVNEIMTLDPDGPGGGQSAVTLANDSNGNLTENPWAFNADDGGTPTGQKYEYDEENRLVRVKRLTSPADQVLLEIGYDAVGRRVETKEYLDAETKQVLSPPRVTHHVVFGPMTIEEYTITAGPTATLAREFVWGTEYPMPAVIIDWTAAGQVGTGQAEVLHYMRDVLGNVVALTNAGGNVVERYRYDPYGMTHIYTGGGALLPASAYGNPYAYTGQRYDAAVALYHFWYRTYSPSLGRWHQRDPLQYADGVSLYEYVASSPVELIDPLGGWVDRHGIWHDNSEPHNGQAMYVDGHAYPWASYYLGGIDPQLPPGWKPIPPPGYPPGTKPIRIIPLGEPSPNNALPYPRPYGQRFHLPPYVIWPPRPAPAPWTWQWFKAPLPALANTPKVPIVVAVVGAAAVGAGAGMLIDHFTGASDYIGEALYDLFPSWFDEEDKGSCPRPSE